MRHDSAKDRGDAAKEDDPARELDRLPGEGGSRWTAADPIEREPPTRLRQVALRGGVTVHVGAVGRTAGAPPDGRILSRDELDRAARFKTDVARDRFVARRRVLRQVLASELEIDPRRVTFRYGPYGKPSVCDPASAIEFSVSHAGDVSAIAVSRSGRIGVDIELAGSAGRPDALARVCLSRREFRQYWALPAEEREDFVLRSWTAKEAYLKGVGVGLSVALSDIDVFAAVACGEAIEYSEIDPAVWHCAVLPVEPTAVLAVAIESVAAPSMAD